MAKKAEDNNKDKSDAKDKDSKDGDKIVKKANWNDNCLREKLNDRDAKCTNPSNKDICNGSNDSGIKTLNEECCPGFCDDLKKADKASGKKDSKDSDKSKWTYDGEVRGCLEEKGKHYGFKTCNDENTRA